MTPDESRYAVDVIWALELSGTDVPASLRQMYDQYKQEQESVGIL